MVIEKLWVSANFTRVMKSLHLKLRPQNLELGKNNAGLGILTVGVSQTKAKVFKLYTNENLYEP